MLKILIAEDDRELRTLFSRVLTKNGYSVEGVANGQDALDVLHNEYYDMIISDIMMPVIDGYELVRRLRESGNTTPVMMGENRFIDSSLWIRFLDHCEARLDRLIAKEKESGI